MTAESTKSVELLRSKIFRINQEQKERLVLFLETFYKLNDLKFVNIYLGGSQSKYSDKYPNQESDIDIYIFEEKEESFVKLNYIISEQDGLSKTIQLCLGMKINIYIVNNKFIKSISQGMELLK